MMERLLAPVVTDKLLFIALQRHALRVRIQMRMLDQIRDCKKLNMIQQQIPISEIHHPLVDQEVARANMTVPPMFILPE